MKIKDRYVAFLTDTHAGARNDSELFADYQEKFYKEVFFPVCKERGIEVVLHGGDYFDRRKFINFKTLSRNYEMFIEPLIENNMEMHMIVGNHDVAYKNTNNLNSPELLLSSFSDRIFIYTEPQTIETEKHPIHMVPWINRENYDSTKQFLDNAEPSLVIGHFDIQGFAMHKGGIVSQHGLDPNYFGKHKKVLSGHYHTQSESGKIQYTGNPFEFTWADYNDPRGFWILDTHTFDMEFVQNPYSMFYKFVYDSDDPQIGDIKDCYVKVVVSSKDDPYEFDLWLDKVYAKSPQEVQIIEMINELSSEMTEEELREQAKSTEEIIQSYVNGLNDVDDGDKTFIKKLMKELHLEAINEL